MIVCIVLGTGGAARAVIACMRELGCDVEIVYREPKSVRTKSLLADYPEMVARPVGEFSNLLRRGTIVVDATSACMEGSGSPVPPARLRRDLETAAARLKLAFCVAIRTDAMFLRCAQSAEIAQVDGISMMVHQAREARGLPQANLVLIAGGWRVRVQRTERKPSMRRSQFGSTAGGGQDGGSVRPACQFV